MLCLSFTPLLVLVLGVSLGAAFPQGALRKSCSLSKYKFITRHEMKAARKMMEHFVSTTGNLGLWAGGGQCREDAEFETLGDKVDVFQGSLGTRRMLGQTLSWFQTLQG